MVTLQKLGDRYNRLVLELVGKSTDTKPTNATGGIDGLNISNGSQLFMMDTGDVFMFDADADAWIQL